MLRKLSVVVVLLAIAVWYFTIYNSNKATSVVFLALNYLARPNVHLGDDHMFKPINLPSAWNGTYMKQNPHIWMYQLTDEDRATMTAGVEYFQSLNKSLETLTIQDFPVTADFLRKIKEWKLQLSGQGRGFQVIRGVPVQRWTMKQNEIFFFALGKYLGSPGAQDVEGSLLGHVINVGATNKTERPYRKSVDIAYHCDGADVVGLLCIHPAKVGGASRIISSVTAFNTLLAHPRGQEYIRRLFGKVLLFTRKTFGLSPYLPVYPLRLDAQGVLRTYWNQEFYSKSYRHLDNGTLTENGLAEPFVLEAVEAYDAILDRDIALGRAEDEAPQRQMRQQQQTDTGAEAGATGAEAGSSEDAAAKIEGAQEVEEELGLSMHLQQGDIQLVSNHFVLHARTEFTDYTAAEIAAATSAAATGGVGEEVRLAPIGQRELLRLWLSHPASEMDWPQYLSKQADLLKVISAVLEGVIKYR